MVLETQKTVVASPEHREVSVFLCYRQVDGSDAARRIFELLDDRELDFEGHGSRLSIYFDQNAPATGDWTKIHRPSLEIARAMIFICTPGAFTKLSEKDWVYKELEWWVANRDAPPIIVDTTGEGKRWSPEMLRSRWPNAQLLRLPELPATGEEGNQVWERFGNRIVDGIRLSEAAVLFQDYENTRQAFISFRRVSLATAFLSLISIAGVFVAVLLFLRFSEAQDSIEAIVKETDGVVEDLRRISKESEGLSTRFEEIDVYLKGIEGKISEQERSVTKALFESERNLFVLRSVAEEMLNEMDESISHLENLELMQKRSGIIVPSDSISGKTLWELKMRREAFRQIVNSIDWGVMDENPDQWDKLDDVLKLPGKVLPPLND